MLEIVASTLLRSKLELEENLLSKIFKGCSVSCGTLWHNSKHRRHVLFKCASCREHVHWHRKASDFSVRETILLKAGVRGTDITWESSILAKVRGDPGQTRVKQRGIFNKDSRSHPNQGQRPLIDDHAADRPYDEHQDSEIDCIDHCWWIGGRSPNPYKRASPRKGAEKVLK